MPGGRTTRLWLAGILLAGLALRVWLLAAYPSLYADEAVSALMVKHIAEGRDFPAFYYGQAYLGALESYLTAPLVYLVGWHWRLVLVWPVLASLGLAVGAFLLARSLATPAAGLAAAALVALPGAAVARVMVTGGAFSLAALLQVATVAWLICRPPVQTRAWALFGLLCGVTGWTWQLWWIALPALVVAAVRWRRPKAKAVAWATLGGLAGALPLVVQNVVDPFSTWWSLAPRLGIFRGVPPERWAAASGAVLRNPGVDYRLESLAGLAGDNALLLAGGGAAAAWWIWRCLARREASPAVRGSAVLLLVLFGLTWLPGVSAQRYLLVPATLLAALAAAAATRAWSRRAGLAALAVLLGLNLLTYRSVAVHPWQTPSFFEHLASTLASVGPSHGWSDYWTAYPVTLLTGERVILAPGLVAPDGVFVDRYPPYRDEVEASPEIRLVLEPASPDLPAVEAAVARGDCAPLEPLDNWWITTCREFRR